MATFIGWPKWKKIAEGLTDLPALIRLLNDRLGALSVWVATAHARLNNETDLNILDFRGAKNIQDATDPTDDALAAASAALPALGGRIRFPTGNYRYTKPVDALVEAKLGILFVGDNQKGIRGNTAPGPSLTVFYVKELNTHFYTKRSNANQFLGFDGVAFDGSNGGVGVAAFSGLTCPGIVNANGFWQYNFMWERSAAFNFGYAHNNNAGSRALLELQTVVGTLDNFEISYAPNARGLYFADGSTHTLIRRGEFTVLREARYLYRCDNFVLDHCVYESLTTIGAVYQSQAKEIDPWCENVGFNSQTAWASGIALRDHGLGLVGALAGAIVNPFQQLYGSYEVIRPKLNSFAPNNGANLVHTAWFESVGQASGTDQGGVLLVDGGVKASGTALFSATMAFGSTERNQYFHVYVPRDGWGTAAGSRGTGLFNGSGQKDYRKVSLGSGRIWMNGGAQAYLFTIKRGRLISDVHDIATALSGTPGAAVYPQGDQWEIGDTIDEPVPVAGGVKGRICTTAGTAGAVWKTYGAIAA